MALGRVRTTSLRASNNISMFLPITHLYILWEPSSLQRAALRLHHHKQTSKGCSARSYREIFSFIPNVQEYRHPLSVYQDMVTAVVPHSLLDNSTHYLSPSEEECRKWGYRAAQNVDKGEACFGLLVSQKILTQNALM